MISFKMTCILALASMAAASNFGHSPSYSEYRPSAAQHGGYSGGQASASASAGANTYSNFGAGGYGAHIPILRYENVNQGDGNYRYSYETGNVISAQESGAPRAQGPEGPAVTAEGSFSYRAPDGQQVALSYTADENGFHPVGAHLPTPPPIPEEILRSLQYNSQHPGEGSYEDRYHGRHY